MTLEQLETHRSNFEGFYEKHSKWTKQELTVLRQGQGYSDGLTHSMWCAYCWALTDVDRAQRAAPGVQEGEMPTGAVVNGRVLADRLEHDCKFECEAGSLAMCSEWQEFRRCFEYLAAHPPQQSAQPVVEFIAEQPVKVQRMQKGCFRCNTPKKCDIYGCSPLTWPAETATQPVEVQRQVTPAEDAVFRAAAMRSAKIVAKGKLVEVQRVGLTNEEIWNIDALISGERDHVIEFTRAVEAHHGIKPASEGGAAC